MFKRMRSRIWLDWHTMSRIRRVILVVLCVIGVWALVGTFYSWDRYFKAKAYYEQHYKQFEGMTDSEIRRELLRQRGAIDV